MSRVYRPAAAGWCKWCICTSGEQEVGKWGFAVGAVHWGSGFVGVAVPRKLGLCLRLGKLKYL